jgi:hypothetical protein
MSFISSNTHYFSVTGPDNTLQTMLLARARMDQLGISTVVVATTDGSAGVKALSAFAELNLVCVSHVQGFKGPDMQELTPENRSVIQAAGVPIVTAAHAFSGINRAIRGKFATYEPTELMASTLRIFGEGMKVAVEITLMAADAGAIRVDAPIAAIAGSGHGSDTAVILQPTCSHTFFDLKVVEIICMPSPLHPGIAAS